jgi:hypothetical protein
MPFFLRVQVLKPSSVAVTNLNARCKIPRRCNETSLLDPATNTDLGVLVTSSDGSPVPTCVPGCATDQGCRRGEYCDKVNSTFSIAINGVCLNMVILVSNRKEVVKCFDT